MRGGNYGAQAVLPLSVLATECSFRVKCPVFFESMKSILSLFVLLFLTVITAARAAEALSGRVPPTGVLGGYRRVPLSVMALGAGRSQRLMMTECLVMTERLELTLQLKIDCWRLALLRSADEGRGLEIGSGVVLVAASSGGTVTSC